MGQQHCFHAPGKSAVFLGWRLNRNGRTEIVYDDCQSTRLVWRADFDGNAESRLDEALSCAVAAGREKMIPTLFDELQKRAIFLSSL